MGRGYLTLVLFRWIEAELLTTPTEGNRTPCKAGLEATGVEEVAAGDGAGLYGVTAGLLDVVEFNGDGE